MTKHLSSSKARRLTLQGLLAAAAVGLGVTAVVTQIDSGNPVQAAQIETQAEEELLDADTYYAIERLRSELKLTHRDLAFVGCDTPATHGALTNLLNWYETNKSSLFEARNALLAARKNLYEASRTSEDGRGADMKSLAQAVTTARQALEQVQALAMAQVEPAFTDSQRQRLEAARSNTDIIGDLRYVVGLSETQKQRITEAQTLRSKADQVLSAAGLSGSQQRDLVAMREQADLRDLEVMAGELTALPVPASILAERAAEALPFKDESRE